MTCQIKGFTNLLIVCAIGETHLASGKPKPIPGSPSVPSKQPITWNKPVRLGSALFCLRAFAEQ